jgi:uncharacterized protein YggL (DUF469 family)
MQSTIRLSFDAKNMAQFIKELMTVKKGMILELRTKFADIEQVLCVMSTGEQEEVQREVYNWLELRQLEIIAKSIDDKEVKPS